MVIGLGLSRRHAEAGEGAGRVARGAALLGAAIRDALGFIRSGDARLLGAPAWWAFDAAVLWATFHALGEPPSLAILAFAYFAGQVGNTIPLPGAVSGGMVGTLLAFGVAPDLAISSVFAYRAVAIWLPAPMGLAALGALRARVARWGREHDEAAELVVSIVEPVAADRARRARAHAGPRPADGPPRRRRSGRPPRRGRAPCRARRRRARAWVRPDLPAPPRRLPSRGARARRGRRRAGRRA